MKRRDKENHLQPDHNRLAPLVAPLCLLSRPTPFLSASHRETVRQSSSRSARTNGHLTDRSDLRRLVPLQSVPVHKEGSALGSNMRRSSQLSFVHHLRKPNQSNVSGILDSSILQTETTSAAEFFAWKSQRSCVRSGPIRRGIVDYRQFSTSSQSSPFSDNNHSNDNKKKAPTGSPDFSNIPGARLPKTTKKSTRVLEINKEQADEAFRSCLQMVKKHDVDNYLAILTMSRQAQPEIVALNALNVELASIRDKVDTRRGDTSAMYRLQFWKDAISSIYGLSHLPVPRQPVAIALCLFAGRANSDLLLKLVESRQSTIGDRQFPDLNSLCEYGKSTTGSLLCLQIDALARNSPSTVVLPPVYDVAKDIGAAYAIANILRATHPLLTRGIVLLPADVMSLNGATPDSIYKKKKIEETCGMTKDLTNESKRLLMSARDRMQMVPKTVRPALAAVGATTDYVIRTIEKNKYDIYSPHLQRRNPLLLWSLLVRKLFSKF